MAGPEYAYVQARLQARHGSMPQPSSWQVLEASHTAGHFLAHARSGPLAPWVEGQDPSRDAHRAEQQLRQRWRRYVDDLAAWQPPRWRPATRWFGSLPELALTKPPAVGAEVAHWLQAWLKLMPAGDARVAPLRRVATLLMPGLVVADRERPSHAAAPAAPAAPAARAASAASAAPVRRALLGLFRRHTASPVAVFAHLALVALDVERLRGGLVTRILFEPAPAGAPQGA